MNETTWNKMRKKNRYNKFMSAHAIYKNSFYILCTNKTDAIQSAWQSNSNDLLSCIIIAEYVYENST